MKKVNFLLFLMVLFVLPAMVFAKEYTEEITQGQKLVTGDIIKLVKNADFYVRRSYVSGSYKYNDTNYYGVKYYYYEEDEDGNLVYNEYVPENEDDYLVDGYSSSYYYTSYYPNDDVVMPKLFGKNVRWEYRGIEEVGYNSTSDYYYYGDYEVGEDGMLVSYTAKYFTMYQLSEEINTTISCDLNNISVGEKASCEINLKYDYILSNVSFKLITDKLTIDNIELSEDWTKEETDGGFILTYNGSSEDVDFSASKTIATFEVVYTEDVEEQLKDDIKVQEFNYTSDLGDNQVDDFSYEVVVSQEKKEPSVPGDNKQENPNTFDIGSNLMIIILLLLSIVLLQYRSKLKIFKKDGIFEK